MNNILSFNEYSGQEIRELEAKVYDELLNEKSTLNKGIRGFFNRRASGRVRSELEEEIEMSKTIMEGIKTGLESLNENFEAIEKNLENKNEVTKGKNQKTLEAIRKILDDSRKNTWDLNELIDEGDIDYTGFTANVGIASVAYFGILLTPFRAAVMIHKGYNYFFNIVKNTIRKSLVMLQLNFDQFENLIITKGFQSADYIQADDSSSKISEFYGNLNAELFGDKGKMKGKRGYKEMQLQLKAAKDRFDQQMKADKVMQQADNAYNCLDQYNNTYTRSLETLRQYSQDDIQKQLDSIKTSMSKLAGQEVDLQTYSELIIAAAEEHAYSVSSSIYNKFAKMTEVFSLPNQQKMIDLILAANKEQKSAAKKAREERKQEKEYQEKLEGRQKMESDGLDIFKSVEGTEIGELGGNDDDEVRKYDDSDIKAEGWTYEKFKELDDDKKEAFESWLSIHPEVLKKCDRTLQVAIYTPFNDAYHEYVDSLVDYIGPCINESVNEEYTILNFDEYVLNEEEEKKDKRSLADLDDEKKNEIKDNIKAADSYADFKSRMFGKDHKFTDEDITDLENCILVLSEDSEYKEDGKVKKIYSDWIDNFNKCIEKAKNGGKKTVKIDFSEISTSQSKDLKEMYVEDKDGKDMSQIATTALVVIGDRLLNDKTFVKNAKDIVNIIKECLTKKVVKISPVSYKIISESIDKLKELRDADYFNAEEDSKKKSEE